MDDPNACTYNYGVCVSSGRGGGPCGSPPRARARGSLALARSSGARGRRWATPPPRVSRKWGGRGPARCVWDASETVRG